jgi:hemerythrin-like domain-containing protein
MPTTTTRSSRGKTTRSAASKSSSTRAQDAIALLKADHKTVDQMFKSYEEAKTATQKGKLASQICEALKVHTQIEEEIFYPACRGEIEEDMLDEAKVEHASCKQLIAEIEAMQPGEDLYDAKVTVLGEYVRHHVKEEEQEMFPEARKTDLDLKALGAQMAARKTELEQQLKAKVQ